MLLRDFLPASSLREFVQCYRIVHLNFDNFNDIPFKAYPPKPEQCLHFFLRDFLAIQKSGNKKEVQPAVMLAGQRTTLFNHYTGRDFIDVQIVFQPTAVFQLTGIPAFELTDQHLDANHIFSNHVQVVLDQLQSANGYPELLYIIESFAKKLVSHVSKNPEPLDFISNQMKLTAKNYSVDNWSKQSYLCVRQFERKFLERVGVNPKTYARIIRFNKAFNLKNRHPSNTWSGIAMAVGYHDYQHLVKDYKAFTGMNPSEFHSLELNSPESVLGLTKTLYHMRYQNTF